MTARGAGNLSIHFADLAILYSEMTIKVSAREALTIPPRGRSLQNGRRSQPRRDRLGAGLQDAVCVDPRSTTMAETPGSVKSAEARAGSTALYCAIISPTAGVTSAATIDTVAVESLRGVAFRNNARVAGKYRHARRRLDCEHASSHLAGQAVGRKQ